MDLKSLPLAALAFSFALPPTHVLAQDEELHEEATQDPPEQDAIIVSGNLPEDSDIRGAVRAVMQERGNTDPIHRYLDPLCLHVTGMNAQSNAFVRARMLANAEEAEIDLGEEGCTANAIVFVVAEPGELLDLLQERQPWLLTSDERRRVEHEAGEGEPVLVWHNFEDRSAQGNQIAHSATVPGAGGSATPLSVNVRVNTQARPSRSTATHSTAVQSGVVVLDMDWLVGMDLERISDFATMRLLAPGLVPFGHEFTRPTSVTSPFIAEEGETEMTRFDRAYLRALYGLQPNAAANRLPAAVLREYESDG
ncbi:hypothetical protein [Aurantiacibacter sp. D1-12]|uniref:hypothetical protein n=1 Tax=Aurantiacibacter sp. D1-12 TaxID=2993658 RepID=UPI00237CF79F|nr:hypothetical protein [Aurantiacibacter sp. D1-12]MDE1467913.1 hypothetical protein [Aurantiacibacter sp. D1-12]